MGNKLVNNPAASIYILPTMGPTVEKDLSPKVDKIEPIKQVQEGNPKALLYIAASFTVGALIGAMCLFFIR